MSNLKNRKTIANIEQQKLVFILISIVVAGTSSGYATLMSDVSAIKDNVKHNEIQLAVNNIPELKEFISNEFYEQQQLIQSQNRKIDNNQNAILENYKLLCKMANGDC